MSHGRAIDPLPLDQFPTEADSADPGFEELFGQLVGDAGTPADGFEDDLAIANTLLDDLDNALGEMGGQEGGTLDDTFLEILAVDPAPAGEDVVNLSAALPDVQGNVDNLGNLLATAALPAPGTGTGGGAMPAGCDAVLGFDTANHNPPITRQVVLNIGGTTVTEFVDSVTLTQDTPGLFTLTADPPGPYQVGQQFNITVTLNATAATGIRGKVTIATHDNNNAQRTSVLCLGVGVPDNFPPPPPGSVPPTGPPPSGPPPTGGGPPKPPPVRPGANFARTAT